MRNVPLLVSAALSTGLIPVTRFEFFDVVTQTGDTFYWSTYDHELTIGGNLYLPQNPFLKRSKWSVTNTMTVPEMTITLLSLLDGFNGGSDIRSQIVQGLLDGAVIRMSYGYIDSTDGSYLGAIDDIFGGEVSTAEVQGTKAEIKIKGANNKLDQNAPRRVYQISCGNTFCDPGCTLSRGSFTFSFIVDAGVTRSFIPWTVPPVDPSLFQLGTFVATSGAASGQSMNIDFADASGLTLANPLYNTPSPGDTFDAFEGCTKTITLCTARGNQQNGLWFPFIPPAETAL